MIKRPNESEFPEFYHTYIKQIPDVDIIEFLEKQKRLFVGLVDSIPEDQLLYRYAEGKWTIKQVIGHIIDTERIMAFRALVFSRGERQAIPGFDENEYVEKGAFNKKEITSLIDEFLTLRASNLAMIKNFDENMALKKGNANDFWFSVRSLVYIIAGHTEHHMQVIKSKYLKA